MDKIIKSIIVSLVLILNLQANYIEGKDVFLKKCVSCHAEYIPINKLIDNFRNKNNKLLNLKAQAFNRIEYKILRGKKQIGSSDDDIDIRKDAVLDYLKDFLYNPRDEISLSSKRSRSHYSKKQSMKGKISQKELEYLVDFIFDYKINHTFKIIKATSKLNEAKIIEEAINNNKSIIVEAISKSCHYCKKMKENVLSLEEVQNKINQKFIFIEVDIDKTKLPFNLQKDFPNITPTFFFLDNKAQLKSFYPGAWKKDDFFEILKENKE